MTSPNHFAAANRRFRIPSGALLWFERSVCARRPLTEPVTERERSASLHASFFGEIPQRENHKYGH
jgi:hypothetical protein